MEFADLRPLAKEEPSSTLPLDSANAQPTKSSMSQSKDALSVEISNFSTDKPENASIAQNNHPSYSMESAALVLSTLITTKPQPNACHALKLTSTTRRKITANAQPAPLITKMKDVSLATDLDSGMVGPVNHAPATNSTMKPVSNASALPICQTSSMGNA